MSIRNIQEIKITGSKMVDKIQVGTVNPKSKHFPDGVLKLNFIILIQTKSMYLN